jgi:hypothetical protein
VEKQSGRELIDWVQPCGLLASAVWLGPLGCLTTQVARLLAILAIVCASAAHVKNSICYSVIHIRARRACSLLAHAKLPLK